MVRVNPEFAETLKKFGAQKVTECFNCGNCTAICPLSDNKHMFPRKLVRYIQLGLEEKIKQSLEPWLCYYCGECSSTCPRQADPGEIMMAMRRYLTTVYDWTGISKRIYTSKGWKLFLIALFFAIPLIAIYLFHGHVHTDHTDLETFAPAHIVHPVGYAFGTILAILVLSNIYRMHKFVMSGEKIPKSLYLSELKTLAVHFLTQAKLRLCEDKSMWWKHWLLMSGYTVAFILVQIDYPLGQILGKYPSLTDYPFPPPWHPVKIAWTYSMGAMLIATTIFMIERVRKRDPVHKYSHSTDWMFLILLWCTVFTGLLTRIFMELDWPLPTYYAFSLHLAFTVPLLGLEVPFAKWSHLAYRPFALYFARVKERYEQMKASS